MAELQAKRKNLIGRNDDPGATPTWQYQQIVPGKAMGD